MARTMTIASVESEIARAKTELAKIDEKRDSVLKRLEELEQMKEDIEAKQVMDAFRKSGKDIGELMNFLSAKADKG